ncbi:hypothetical protein [Vreelandella zhaodongensis]|uniref:hypothetical protein n=1 Tax=Vreelandella zhaodongensis TaxID=1176240 RepID=UPI003EBBBC73
MAAIRPMFLIRLPVRLAKLLLDQPVPPRSSVAVHKSTLLTATTVHTVRLLAGGKLLGNQTFMLCGTPAEKVVLEGESLVKGGQTFTLPCTLFSTPAWIGRRLDNAKG